MALRHSETLVEDLEFWQGFVAAVSELTRLKMSGTTYAAARNTFRVDVVHGDHR
jgi:hypothetical protein